MGEKYILVKTSALDMHGVRIDHGGVIELDNREFIRKLNNLGFLRPLIEDTDEDDDEEEDDDERPEANRQVRKPA